MLGRRLRSVTGVAVAAAVLQGCWLQAGFDAGHTRHNDLEDELTAGDVGSLAEVWSAGLLPGAAEPMVRGNRVFVTTGGFDPVSRDSAIATRAYHSATGNPAWSRTLVSFCCEGPSIVYPTPAFVGDELWTGYFLLYTVAGRPVGGYANPVRLDPADGSTLGRESLVSVSPAVEAGSHVVQTQLDVATQQRRLVVRHADTLALEWSAQLPGTLIEGPLRVAPAVADGLIAVADTTSLLAYPLDGCGSSTCGPTWARDLGTQPRTVAHRPGSGEVLTMAGEELLALSPATGETLWSAPLGATGGGLAVTADMVYVGAASTLRAFAAGGCGAASCEPEWTAPLGTSATAAPTVAGGVVYVGGTGVVEAFAAGGCGAATCPSLGSVAVGGPVDHVVVADGRLLTVSRPTAGAARLSAFAPA